jgi:hypothetical protein
MESLVRNSRNSTYFKAESDCRDNCDSQSRVLAFDSFSFAGT